MHVALYKGYVNATNELNNYLLSPFNRRKGGARGHAGVVSLTGEVPDLMTSANASWTAWFVPGVKSVKNDLMLKEKK